MLLVSVKITLVMLQEHVHCVLLYNDTVTCDGMIYMQYVHTQCTLMGYLLKSNWLVIYTYLQLY